MVASEEVVRVKRTFSLPYTEDLKGKICRGSAACSAPTWWWSGLFSPPGAGESRLRIDLRVVRVPEGTRWSRSPRWGRRMACSSWCRGSGGGCAVPRLGEPSPADARAAAALQPGSPEAARLYAEGLTRLRAFDSLGARDLLQGAAGADPDSAVIHSALSLAWIGLGDDVKAREQAEKAVGSRPPCRSRSGWRSRRAPPRRGRTGAGRERSTARCGPSILTI